MMTSTTSFNPARSFQVYARALNAPPGVFEQMACSALQIEDKTHAGQTFTIEGKQNAAWKRLIKQIRQDPDWCAQFGLVPSRTLISGNFFAEFDLPDGVGRMHLAVTQILRFHDDGSVSAIGR